MKHSNTEALEAYFTKSIAQMDQHLNYVEEQNKALREALEEWDNSFCWRVCPDKKGDHTVEDFVIQRCLKATRKALATSQPSED